MQTSWGHNIFACLKCRKTLGSFGHKNCWIDSPTRKLQCCGVQLLRNFHVFAQPRNFCHGAQLRLILDCFYLIWWLGSDPHPSVIRASALPTFRSKAMPRALPVSGGRARVNVVIARTETSVAALNSSASNDLIDAACALYVSSSSAVQRQQLVARPASNHWNPTVSRLRTPALPACCSLAVKYAERRSYRPRTSKIDVWSKTWIVWSIWQTFFYF